MKNRSGKTKLVYKAGGRYLFAIVFLFGVLFVMPVKAGKAQESTPSVATDDSLPDITPTFIPEVLETGSVAATAVTATPVLEPPSLSSTRILITIGARARILNVMDRLDDYGSITEVPELTKLGVFTMQVPTDHLAERMAQIQEMTGVLYVEQDAPVWATDTLPNDPGFVNQYALNSIRAPQGWDLSTGSNAVTIAVLDSGVDFGHVDLAGKLVSGYDFVNADSNPQDDYGHGTHVAGIAAASGNNGAGIAGVSWGAQIMPVKVLNSVGNGSYSQVAAGIVWAVDHGAQVINLSLGGAGLPPSALHSAILYAYNNNVLLVASSGNTGSNFVLYPARYPEVIAVGASNMSNQPASFSNYGPEIDLAAPGENIYSLWPGGYNIQSGTSMSAPHVSGLAAILYGYINNANSVRNVMETTALDIGPVGWDSYSGAGLIQMDSALAMVVPPTTTPVVGGTGNQPSPLGGLPVLLSATPTLMVTPFTSTLTVTPTATTFSLGTPTLESTDTAPVEVTSIAVHENKIKRLKVFLSPYFCGAALLIFLGLWILQRESRGRNRANHFHNKSVK